MKQLLLFIISLSVLQTMAQDKNQHGEHKFLALGDSYTIGESVTESERWPVQLVSALNKRGVPYSAPKIIATTGWRTDDLKNAILKDSPSKDYQLVSLLIGVNNQYQGKSV